VTTANGVRLLIPEDAGRNDVGATPEQSADFREGVALGLVVHLELDGRFRREAVPAVPSLDR
jgi:hypothetical protein